MDKYKITQIVYCFIVFLVFVGLGIWFMTGRGFHIGTGIRIQNVMGPYSETGSYDISAANIDSIDLDWIAGGITVTPYNGTEIKLVEYAQRDLKEDEVLFYEVIGSKLMVEFYDKDTGVHLLMPPKKLEVMVPEELAGNLKEFIVDNVSSEVSISNLTAHSFCLDSVSGKVEISDIQTDVMKLESTSGKILFEDSGASESTLKSISGTVTLSNVTSTDQLSINTTSGEINLETVKTQDLSLDTISGSVEVNGNFVDIKAESTSGAIDIQDEVTPESFDIHSISGKVTIAMPSFEGMNLKHHSVSGKFNSDFPLLENGDGSGNYRIETTSGSISVKKLN